MVVVGTAREEQGAEEAQEGRDEQDIAEGPVIGLDYGCVSVLHKEPQNHSCEDRQAQSPTSQGPPQRILKSQEGRDFGEAATSLTVWILELGTGYTALRLGKEQRLSVLVSQVLHFWPF